MDSSAIIEMLSGLASWVPEVLKWVGIAVSVATVVVLATPTKKDDGVLNKILELPLLGAILKALSVKQKK